MHYFIVFFDTEGGKIKVHFEIIYSSDRVKKIQPKKTPIDNLTEANFIANEELIQYPLFCRNEANFLEQESSISIFKARLITPSFSGNEENYYQTKSYTYNLPTNSKQAVNLITILDQFAQRKEVLINDESIQNYIENNTLAVDLWKFTQHKPRGHLGDLDLEYENPLAKSARIFSSKHFIIYYKLLKLINIPVEYQPLIKKLQAILSYGAFLNNQLSFFDYLTNDFLNLLIATQKNPTLLIDPSVSESEKKVFLDQIKKDLYMENKVFDWENTFNILKEKAIVDLYTPCLTQKAHDGNPYHYRHTELQFLRNIVLILPSNNKMRATNFHNNTAYQEWYAPKRQYHDKFAPELRHLFALIGLELEKCDHEGIIFTENATKKLIPLGLHLLNKNNLSLDIKKGFWQQPPTEEKLSKTNTISVQPKTFSL